MTALRWLRYAGLIFVLLLFSAAAQAGPIYNRAVKGGLVKIGVPYNLAPQGYMTPKGEWVGFEVDFAEELAGHMNLKLQKVKINETNWKQLLAKGQIDAALHKISHSRRLENEVDFSEPYMFDSLCILANKGSLKSTADLKGQKIAVVQGSLAEKSAMKLLRAAGDDNAEKNVVSYPDRPSCFLAIGRDKVGAWLDSGLVVLEYVSKSPGKFELLSVSDSVTPIAVALPQEDSAWRDLINFTIQDMAADGSFKTIYDKWFGQDSAYNFPLRRPIEIWPE